MFFFAIGKKNQKSASNNSGNYIQLRVHLLVVQGAECRVQIYHGFTQGFIGSPA